ncbi:MAG: DUF3450 family protein [Deltaproteobacteria bacterium]|nr:DUF3450 family protein [Candidatus Anaeroferrophillacea bacterium]
MIRTGLYGRLPWVAVTVIPLLFIILCVAMIDGGPPATAAESADGFAAVRRGLQEELNAAHAERRQTTADIAAERRGLQDDIVALQRDVAAAEAELNRLEKVHDQLLAEEKRLAEAQREAIAAMDEVRGTVRTGARDLLALLESSLVSGHRPGRAEPFRELLAAGRAPRMEEIRALIAAYDDELWGSGTVERQPAAMVGLDGRRRQAEVTRIGALTAICQDDEAGLSFAVYGKEHDAFLAVSRVPWFHRRTVKRFLAGEDADVCLDFSGGATVQRLALQPTPWERLKSGGVLVWPILFIGIVALGLSVERFFFLRRVKSNTDTVMGRVTGLVAGGEWDASLELVQRRTGPVYNVLAAGLRARRSTREVLEHVFEEAIMKELPRLEKFLPTLQVLAAVAPLLGLLGTVTGMIDTFQVITIYGTGDPKMMSGGISEALVTTKLGLMVAIPIILIHTFFSRRVEAIIGDMEEKAVGLTVAIINRDNGRAEGA